MIRFEAAVFDFDGTIMDSGPGIMRCAKAVAKELDLRPADNEELRKFIGPPIVEGFQIVYGVSPEEAQKAVEIYRRYYDETGGMKEAEVYPGIRELLADLRQASIKTAIASAKRIPLLEEMVRCHGLSDLFDAVNGPARDAKKVSKAAIIMDTLEILDVPKRDALMIGDSHYDATAAKRDKMCFCGVLWGYGFDTVEQVQTIYPGSYVVRTVNDLRRLLLGE